MRITPIKVTTPYYKNEFGFAFIVSGLVVYGVIIYKHLEYPYRIYVAYRIP
jgi:hypothetical protein